MTEPTAVHYQARLERGDRRRLRRVGLELTARQARLVEDGDRL